jgi:hypothetical protein
MSASTGRPVAANPNATLPIGSAGEAQSVIAHLETIMDSLLATVEEETALVRAGRVREAIELTTVKNDLAGCYLADTQRLKASRALVQSALPDALDVLRARHDTFRALLQINLTVLATAHAVSEGIVRGVADEFSRKRMPQTYGASGRATAMAPRSSQPLALSRTL